MEFAGIALAPCLSSTHTSKVAAVFDEDGIHVRAIGHRAERTALLWIRCLSSGVGRQAALDQWFWILTRVDHDRINDEDVISGATHDR